ncbi:MAG: hypothetical protein ACRD47_04875 [Nitrososphaeraceae archaeon]
MANIAIITGFVAVFNLIMYGYSSSPLLSSEGELFASQHSTITIEQASALPPLQLDLLES